MYINDVWNSQNIPRSKQRSGRILSNVFGKSDRSLEVENIILSQQLTESQKSMKDTERTHQEVIESHQQEIQHSNTRLQETQVQLQHAQQNFQQHIKVIVSDVYIQTKQS